NSFHEVSLEIVRLNLDCLGSPDFLIKVRKTQTSLLILHKAFALDDPRIQKNLLTLRLLGVAGDVHDQQLVRNSDLRGGQGEPTRFVHKILHLTNLQMNLLIDTRKRLGGMAQRRVRIVNNLHNYLSTRISLICSRSIIQDFASGSLSPARPWKVGTSMG